jgi:hypothetical protein
MKMRQSILGLLLLVCSLVVLPALRVDADQASSWSSCAPATKAHPVSICFASKPLRLARCLWRAIPDFTVDIWHEPNAPEVPYRYSYRLLFKGVPDVDKHIRQFGTEADDNPFPAIGSPDLSQASLEFLESGKYQLRVTVTPKGFAAPVSETSHEIEIVDKPRVQGLAVGLSKYSTEAYNLNYAADDAATFADVINRLIEGGATGQIEVRTSARPADASSDALKRDALLKAIRDNKIEINENGDEQYVLCGRDDWYIFYFSGHGVIGPDAGDQIGRYLSTSQFNRSRASNTSIRVAQLRAALEETHAKNLLVVFDSCFSGYHVRGNDTGSSDGRGIRTGPAPRPSNEASGKVQYVGNIESSDFRSVRDPDAEVFEEFRKNLEPQGSTAWFLSAASADQEAEEGPVAYVKDANGQFTLKFDRAPVLKNVGKPGGHGLFTFTLLAHLLGRLPSGMDVSQLLPNGLPATGVGNCVLNFEGATGDAITDIEKVGIEKSFKPQHPEAKPSPTIPPPMNCWPLIHHD